ncbi:MAG: hypothetical protein AB1489_19600 [Acidobacteriota bacterium]
MPLSKRDREFRLPKISYLDFKHLEMDRVLTAFFARLAHNGFPSRLLRKTPLTVEDFAAEFLDHPEWFTGFQDHREILERWVETHLLDVVNRGKSNQAVAAPRPLHGFTYRFRNPKHSRDYGAAQHLYEMLYGARNRAGQNALDHLKDFFFPGQDKVIKQSDTAVLDVETQALLRLLDQVSDAPDNKTDRESYPPLCVGSADLLAEDIQRLLFYQNFIPRSVMVDYLKVLIAFHLGLYHLRLMKLLPMLVKRHGADPICAPNSCPMNPKSADDPHGDCPYRIGLLVDVANRPDTPMAILAERSADTHYRRMPTFICAYFATRKLDEFAKDLVRRGKLTKPTSGEFTVGEVLQLLEPPYKEERRIFFGQRISSLVEDTSGDAEIDPEIKAVTEMGLPECDTYIEMLIALRGAFHKRYLTDSIDSLLLKNRPGALVTQGRTKNASRRFILDSRLLEVLLQIAVLKPGGARGYHTAEMRIDDLLLFLRERYGLFVDKLPRGDGFNSTSIDDRRALRENYGAFIARLREVGFYRDLSDAHVTQTITPRYQIAAEIEATSIGEQ